MITGKIVYGVEKEKKVHNGRMKHLLHKLYDGAGHFMSVVLDLIWRLKDKAIPPKENAVLFVAHPDDDILFFHQFIIEYKPYVVCMTTGSVINRIIPFYRAMRHYKVRYRSFDMKSKDVQKEELICRRIRSIIKNGQFSYCATHNETGEYGHVMHQCIHRCVRKEWSGPLITPVEKKDILKYPLSEKTCLEKNKNLREYYWREYPTLEHFHDWIVNEKLIMLDSQ